VRKTLQDYNITFVDSLEHPMIQMKACIRAVDISTAIARAQRSLNRGEKWAVKSLTIKPVFDYDGERKREKSLKPRTMGDLHSD